ncbi:hypothetical protein BH24GEM2_BH24GEM2_08040 [soil metagenome]
MTVKERLHRLVDTLPEGELHTAERFLEYLRNTPGAVDPVLWAHLRAPLDDLQADPAPVLYTLDNAPPDDEPYTDEERAAVAEAWEDVRAGETIPHQEVKRMFGLA